VIRSFKCKETEGLFQGRLSRKLPQEILRIAARKLEMIAAAPSLNALRVPPANHLEALRGRHAGQHSIRINRQRRICFVWRDGDAYDVESVDYH